MPEVPRISDAEWEVMKVIWEQSPVTANEVVEKLEPHKNWNHRTIKTMIGRLVKKNALTFTKKGKTYLYAPLVSEDECIKSESKSFLQRIFNGNAIPMLSHFVNESDLTEEDLNKLKSILDKQSDE